MASINTNGSQRSLAVSSRFLLDNIHAIPLTSSTRNDWSQLMYMDTFKQFVLNCLNWVTVFDFKFRFYWEGIWSTSNKLKIRNDIYQCTWAIQQSFRKCLFAYCIFVEPKENPEILEVTRQPWKDAFGGAFDKYVYLFRSWYLSQKSVGSCWSSQKSVFFSRLFASCSSCR